MVLPAHVRTWQFQPNNVIGTATATPTNERLLMIGLAGGMLGRNAWLDKDGAASASAGNWTVWGSSDGTGGFGNNDGVNRWDTAGVLDPAKLIWAAAGVNHSWIVLTQTGIAGSYQVCIDLSNATATNATIVVSFGTGFGAAAGGTNGTATARPTALDQQILISNTSWGGGTNLGVIWNCAKSTDGKSFRFWAHRSESCIMWYQFDVPDPVVSGWTSPSVAHAIGQSTTTEQVTTTRFGAANSYSKTPGGTIFPSFMAWEGSQSNTSTPAMQGCANDIDNSNCFRQILLQSTTVNARGINGLMVDQFWANETGQTMVGTRNGEVAPGYVPPAANAVQWVRVGCFWTPWLKGEAYNPRILL